MKMWDFTSPWLWASIGTMATPVVILLGFYWAKRQVQEAASHVKTAVDQVIAMKTQTEAINERVSKAQEQIEALRKTRTAEIILKLIEQWDSKDLQNSRQKLSSLGTKEEVKKKIVEERDGKSEDLYPLIMVSNFFDTLGVMVLNGYLEQQIAYDLFGIAFNTYANLYESVLEDLTYKKYLIYFLKLRDVFKKIEASRSDVEARPT